jgi:nucleotide-binding universal stress UspA family protein
MYTKALVCVDGSELAVKAAAAGAELAAKFDAELHLLTVTKPYKVSPELKRFLTAESLMGEPKYVLDEMTKGILAEARKAAEAAGVKKIKTQVLEGKPARAIVEYAEDHDIDVIVMGCRGVGEKEATLLGSVSLKVGNLAPCSVIMVR